MPYEKVLELVEEKKLDITTINLATITGDFIAYVQKLEEQNDPLYNQAVLVHFVGIASRLLLIKSKALLPSLELTSEEETDIKELERHLMLYKKFKEASNALRSEWNSFPRMKSRIYEASKKPHFFPPTHIKGDDIWKTIKKIRETLSLFTESPEMATIHVVSLETKIKEILHRCMHAQEHSFIELTNSQSRSELVATFLAILHLLREDSITATQKKAFADIHIKKTNSLLI